MGSNHLGLLLYLQKPCNWYTLGVIVRSKGTVDITKWLSDNPRPNRLFPAILLTCPLIHDEALGVLYEENIYRAHRTDDRNHDIASIRRVKSLIGDGDPDYAQPGFLKNHPDLEHLVLEYGIDLLEDRNLRNNVKNMLFRSCYLSTLEESVDSIMQNDFPEDFKKFSDNIMKHYS